jgi:hypothetical protein
VGREGDKSVKLYPGAVDVQRCANRARWT